MANEADRRPSVVERKLVTILSADVAEYSRLMAEDEEQTLRIFRDHSQTFRALVDMHNGRIFNTAGDALLAEFTSPLEAVRCATDIQAALRTRNDLLPRARQVRFRIGVNLGDVMMQGSDLLGDGVNVAARLQGAAEPGGICISGSVYDQIRNKLSLSIESLGERRFKNIPLPVRTFTIAGTEDDRAQAPREKSSLDPGRLVKSAVAALPSFSISRGLLARSAIAVLAVLVVAGGYWAYTAYERKGPVRLSITNASPKPVVAALNVTVLDVQSSALLADAQGRHRPKGEIDSLTDSNNQIAAAASQMHGLGIKPSDRAKVRSLLTQMKNLAVDMSHNEATALEKAGAQLWQDLAKPPKGIGTDAEAAIAKAQQAKTNLDSAVAAVQQAQDGSVSLKATTQALAAYDAFAAACEVAAPFYVSARRSDFAAVAASAHSVSDQLVALGRVSKPSWLFASRARKDAYQTLTANATDAQSQVVQLDELGRRVDAATNVRKISADISRASAIKARLGRLLTSSNAAYSVYNQ